MKKVYISGPITGMPELNKPAFDAYAALLEEQGVRCFNPHDIPAPPNMASMTKKEIWQYYMRECVKRLPDCTEIHFLPGWINSEGACWERGIARMLGLTMFHTNGAELAANKIVSLQDC